MIGRLLPEVLKTDDEVSQCVGALIAREEKGLLAGVLSKLSHTNAGLTEAIAQSLDFDGRLKLALSAPFQKQTWDMVDRLGAKVADAYWLECPVVWADESDVLVAVDRLLKANRPRAAFSAAHFYLKALPERTLLLLVQSVGERSNEASGTYLIDPHDLREALKLLTEWGQASTEVMAALEYRFVEAFDRDVGLPNLGRYAFEHPEFFVQMVAFAYRRSDGGEDPPELKAADPEQVGPLAAMAHAVLDRLKVPGADEDGVHGDSLLDWILGVQGRLSSIGRADIGDQCLGKLLSTVPVGSDGIWPIPPVRDVLEQVANQHIRSGLTVALFNSRGAHWRGEGGEDERDLANKYAEWAAKLKYSHPRVAEILRDMEQTYIRDAEWEDNEARVRRRLRY